MDPGAESPSTLGARNTYRLLRSVVQRPKVMLSRLFCEPPISSLLTRLMFLKMFWQRSLLRTNCMLTFLDPVHRTIRDTHRAPQASQFLASAL